MYVSPESGRGLARWFRSTFVFTVYSPFRLRVSQYLNHSTFPVPASSNAACGFPTLRFPICFISRFMWSIALELLSPAMIRWLLHPFQQKPLRYHERKAVSAFALMYIPHLRSCKLMADFIMSTLPPFLSEKLHIVGSLCSASVTSLHSSYEPFRHPLAFD
jgi:hypothetical protein